MNDSLESSQYLLKNTNEARDAIAKAGITTENVTEPQLKALRGFIDARMVESGNYHNTFRMDRDVSKFMTCSTDQWTGREAVSFNQDGFIGFAGWSDRNNIQPFLLGVGDWLLELSKAHDPLEVLLDAVTSVQQKLTASCNATHPIASNVLRDEALEMLNKIINDKGVCHE